MAAVLKVWRQIESPTPSVDLYLREEHSDPIWNDGAYIRRTLGWRREPQQEQQQQE